MVDLKFPYRAGFPQVGGRRRLRPSLAGDLPMTTPTKKTNRPKLRTPAAAQYTGFAESTLEKLRVHGGGSPYMRIGRVVVYDPDDLDVWLESHKRRSTSTIE
jgi:hypothetical protein